MAARQNDPVTGLYRTLLAFSAVGVLILTAGLIEFVHFEPSSSSGVHGRIVGVYAYDPSTQRTSGPDRETFTRSEQFAAVVDWSNLPNNLTVQAVWFDSFENVVGNAGPGTPSSLSGDTTIAAAVPKDLHFHLPGEYVFAIERIADGQPVEVLARRIVEVERS